MKILVIGLGSMGKRRINLLTKHFKDDVCVVGVDTRVDRREDVEAMYNITTYADLDGALHMERPDSVLICTSPITHGDIILKCLNKQIHVFTELNLLKDRYDEMISVAKSNNLVLFLSSTLMYRKEIQYIQNEVESHSKKIHYRYHVGQYLPDWHPWESYKDFFVNNKKTNGCRELFAIELPWILKTFGKVVDCKVIKDSISSLDLDYPDSYMVMFEHEQGHKGVLNIDVVSRKALRNLEIYSEEMHLSWEGTPASLMKYDIITKQMNQIKTYETIDRDHRYADNIIENAYLEELDIFIKKVLGKENLERYTFIDDLYTLKLIDKIEGVS